MNTLINVLVGFITLFHIYILWLEMFAWTTRGPKVFKNFSEVLFETKTPLTANEGKKIIAFHCSLLFS